MNETLFETYYLISGTIFMFVALILSGVNLLTNKKADSIDLILTLFGAPIISFALGPYLLAIAVMLSPFILVWYITYKIRGK